jgi:hypothetical protein
MKYRRQAIKISCLVSSIFMVLTLAWLTVSLPFVNASQQQAAEIQKSASTDNKPEANDDDNSFANNTTEEKTSNSVNTLSEEYLHDTHSAEYYVTVPSTEYKVEHVSTYIAFHGELISPPPDVC